MMCRNAARAATALAPLAPAAPLLLAASLLLAGPAEARGLFGSKPAAAAKPAPAATAAASAAAVAAPTRASPAERAAAERLDPLARAAFWAREANHFPADLDTQLKLAAALRLLGRHEEAGAAADRAMQLAPTSVEAMLESGRARIGADQAFYAIEPLNAAAAAAPRDWRPHSLLGVAMEQVKRFEDAKGEYARALQLSPENPAVLSNLALLLAAQGDRAQAEALLRRAAAQPTATAQERGNLALVLGLGGKVAEAEQIIRRDLPPELAEQNLAYLRAASAR